MKKWIMCEKPYKGICPTCGKQGQTSWVACPYCGERIKSDGNHKNKKVLCVETGQVFNSVTECAEAMYTTIHGISACINGRYKTTCGYHFKVVK